MKEYSKVVGVDLGDSMHHFCVVNGAGVVVERGRVLNERRELESFFTSLGAGVLAVMEAGTFSAWVSRLAQGCGVETVVAHPRRLRMIYMNERKSDERDAEMLARIGRMDISLLSPIVHRGTQAQADLAVVKARDGLVRARGRLLLQVRSMAKCFGVRLPSCSAPSFARKVRGDIPPELHAAVLPLLDSLEQLSKTIREYEKTLEKMCSESYPETEALRQVTGVGSITALAYVLTLEQPARFAKSRDAAAYLGLTPKRDQSGETDKQLRITKAGNSYLRRLLVGCAQYILGYYGPDSRLRRWGLALAERGGKNARKRAVVAVARKLAVLLHRLWSTGEVYEPLRGCAQPQGVAD